MSEAGNWCLIESDPGVFTELIQKFGVTGTQVEELWSLDQDQFETMNPVYGLIFLFKWTGDDDTSGSVVLDSRLEKIFFAKQVINNACATQAILSVLMNIASPDVKLGSTLQDFKDFCGSFDAVMKGLALSNSESIRTVHNSFSHQTLFEFDSKKADKDDDVFHFVSYIPIDGRIYELDGLKEGPIDHGAAGSNWTETVRPIIEARMQRYKEGEIHFNLLAVVEDKIQKCTRLLSKPDVSADESSRLKMQLMDEEARRTTWKMENIRRRHNYLPIIMEMLKLLAQRGQLHSVYDKAKEKTLQMNVAKAAKLAKK
jgi:ubiquitin carboxyl-terminal hydrolase L5